METSKVEYVPGRCNIGPAEIRMRMRAGWFGLGLTVVLWGLFLILRVPGPWRLFLFLPAALGAAGFLQSAFHFCANFGMRGVFNFGASVGSTTSVEQEEFRRKDRAKALQISVLSLVIGLVIAAAGYLSAL